MGRKRGTKSRVDAQEPNLRRRRAGRAGKRPRSSDGQSLPLESRGEAPKVQRSEEARTATQANERSGASGLMERVCERQNLIAALKRVRKNKGSPGIDGMTVDELLEYLKAKWVELKEQLLSGTYQPSAVKQQLIPKGAGGMRQLGIPTVLDRFIQQALLQVLQPIFDPGFSSHSHGFRPGRRAHDAVVEAQRYIQQGRKWVVDVDLAAFFDRVNHDILMGMLAKRIEACASEEPRNVSRPSLRPTPNAGGGTRRITCIPC